MSAAIQTYSIFRIGISSTCKNATQERLARPGSPLLRLAWREMGSAGLTLELDWALHRVPSLALAPSPERFERAQGWGCGPPCPTMPTSAVAGVTESFTLPARCPMP